MQVHHQTPSSSLAGGQYDRINTKLKNGYKLVFEAQTADTEGNVEKAKHLYYQGISQITRAISIRCSDPRLTRDLLQKATFVLNMSKERLRVLEKVVAEPSAPPQEKKEDMDLSDLLEDMDDIHSLLSGAQEAKEVINIPAGVSVFDVDGSGEVTQTGKNASAKVSHLISSKYTNPVSCLQIGDMIYPLVSKASPVLQVGEKQFMFPSLDQANKYVGVILENVDSQQVKDFQKLIMSLTNLRVKHWDDVLHDDSSSSVQSVEPVRPPPPRPAAPGPSSTIDKPYLKDDPPAPRTVDKVSGGIQVTAEVVSAGIVWGSKIGGDLLRKGAHSLKDRIKPSTRNVEISDNTREQMATLRTTTKEVSVLTGQAVVQLANGISALAKLVAPHVTAGVKKVINKSDNKYVNNAKGRISEQNLKDACQVGASALAGLVTLYDGLEEGAKNLGRALAEGANVTVSARYGEAAGSVAEDSIRSVVNVGLTYSQAQKLGGKALAKRAAKSTAAEVVRHNALPSNQKQ